MKPLKLEITGLNSFRESQTIDFGPLLKDGLFGIFGPTGSGKSSILDAITLALYGKVKRAPGGRSGIINAREKGCAVSFTFETTNGDERKCYTVERSFGRSKTSGVETKKARLLELRDGERFPLAEKLGEIDEKMQEIIGINVDDFLRAVVLPQGSFAEFLSLTPKDRAAALQRLFGLHELGQRLNIRLREQASMLKLNRAGIEARLAALAPYDDDALLRCDADCTAAELAQGEARVKYDTAKRSYDEAKGLAQLVAEYDELMAGEPERLEQGRWLDDLRAAIARAEHGRALEPVILALRNAGQNLEETREGHQAAIRAREAAEESLSVARAGYERAKGAYDAEYDPLCAATAKLESILDEKVRVKEKKSRLQALDTRLTEVTAAFEGKKSEAGKATQRVLELDESLAAIEAELRSIAVSADGRRLLDELSRSGQELRRKRAELEGQQKQQEELEADVSGLDAACKAAAANEEESRRLLEESRQSYAALRRRRDEAEREREEWAGGHSLLCSTVERLAALDGQRARHEAEEQEGVVVAEGLASQSNLIDASMETAAAEEQDRQRKRDEIALRRDAERHRQLLATLIADLHAGEPCPLCGALDHPSPFHPDQTISESLLRLDMELRQADLALRDAAQRVRELEQERAQVRASIEKQNQTIAATRGILDSLRSEIRQGLEEVQHPSPLGSIVELQRARDESEQRSAAAKTSIEALAAEAKGLESLIEGQERRMQEFRTETLTLRARAQSKTEARTKLREELELLCADLHREQSRFDARAAGRSIDAIEQEYRSLQDRDRRSEELSSRMNSLREEQRSATAIKEESSDALRLLQVELENSGRRRDELDQEIVAQIEDIRRRLGEIRGEGEEGNQIEESITARRERSSMLKHQHDETRQAHQNAITAQQVALADAGNWATALERAEASHADTLQACERLLREHGFTTISEATDATMADGRLKELRDREVAIESTLKAAAEKRIILETRLEGRRITDAELLEIEGGYTVAELEHQSAIGAASVARAALDDCREKNAEWHEVTGQNDAATMREGTIARLAKYLQGDAFVNYIADERLDEVCRRASHQLRNLTTGRLELSSRPDDGFYIVDNGNGGIERSPSSLSGGETFLVSLSLALALSDTIQMGRAPLEFFFLDEGFGTLDTELLESVMSSLERLRSQHRTIGVITHVSSLRERITKRLLVAPAGELNGSLVTFEEA